MAVKRDRTAGNGSFEVEAIKTRIASLYSLRPRHVGVDCPQLFGTILCTGHEFRIVLCHMFRP